MIAVIDYGAGNIGSIMNMLKRLSIPAVRASDPSQIEDAKGLILPGVGAFDYCMERFNQSGLRARVDAIAHSGRQPVLGICAGLQMMFRRSEEGRQAGLGWLAGDVIRFDRAAMGSDLKIPHMGWNAIQPKPGNPLFTGIENPRFYFVHSYHGVCDDDSDVAARAAYGYDFCCAITRGNLYGAQFHPEKSHRYGMALLRNFARITESAPPC